MSFTIIADFTMVEDGCIDEALWQFVHKKSAINPKVLMARK